MLVSRIEVLFLNSTSCQFPKATDRRTILPGSDNPIYIWILVTQLLWM